MTKVAILGGGQIGRAVYNIITDLRETSKNDVYSNIDAFVIDVTDENIFKLKYGSHYVMNLNECSIEELSNLFTAQMVTHVINALPFFLNEKVAHAAANANCAYIDFTEDDVMADKVQDIYEGLDIDCAVKCGLAPGFINYIGYHLVGKIDTPKSLLVSVGALPRTVSFDLAHPEQSYNLTWSVDGLVNEYIRPCRVRKDGVEMEINALNDIVKVILDGTEYEAACTSGGVGSLIRDLKNVPNIQYMTLRYPGHYKYIRSVVHETHGNFEAMRKIFLNKFPFTDSDVIVVYADALGEDESGNFIRRSYSTKFYGVEGLTAIQSTTAGSGVAMLELMLTEKVQGLVNHSTVNLGEFIATRAYKKYYSLF